MTLVSRSDCHLCEEMLAALEALQGGFALDIIDVDEHPELAASYSALVPVLLDGENEICHYFLDVERLAAHLHTKECDPN